MSEIQDLLHLAVRDSEASGSGNTLRSWTAQHVVAIFELDPDGKVLRDTRYYAKPSEAPQWRAEWTEHIEPLAP